jgi:predicted lipoprotein with Yx(FWY)xxD motif
MRHSITRSAQVVALIAAAALLFAACGDSDDEQSSDSAAAPPSRGAETVSVQDIDGTDVLVDSEGRTLYSAEVEKGGKILCTDACTSFWDPVVATGDEAASASTDAQLGVVERPDGTMQLTAEGLPLYTFTDEDPGQLEGDGFVDDFDGTHFEWQAATATAGGGSGSAESTTPADSSSGNYDY